MMNWPNYPEELRACELDEFVELSRVQVFAHRNRARYLDTSPICASRTPIYTSYMFISCPPMKRIPQYFAPTRMALAIQETANAGTTTRLIQTERFLGGSPIDMENESRRASRDGAGGSGLANNCSRAKVEGGRPSLAARRQAVAT